MPGNGNPNPGPPDGGGPPGNPNPGTPPGQLNALDDFFSFDEDTLLFGGDLFADNGAGADVGDPITVTEVNGEAANVGSTITVSTTDPDGIQRDADLTVQSDGTVTLDPLGNFNDLDEGDIAPLTFTYSIFDGTYTDTATVTVDVTGTNDAPEANPDFMTGSESFGSLFSPLLNDEDVDGDDDFTNFSLDSIDDVRVSGIVAGMLTTGNVSIVTVKGVPGFEFNTGTDFDELDVNDVATVEVDYTMSDDSGASSSSTVTYTMEGSNDVPVANPDVVEGGETFGFIGAILGNDTDVDGDDDFTNFSLDSIGPITVTGIAAGELTTGSVSMATVKGQPGISFSTGTDFEELDDGDVATVVVPYTMSDDSGASSSSTVTIIMNGSNSAPVATNDSFTISEDDDLVVLGNLILGTGGATADSDPEDHVLTVTAVNGVAGNVGSAIPVTGLLPDGTLGTASLTVQSDGTVTLNPMGNFDALAAGQFSLVDFTYTISDGTLLDTANVQVTIDGVNDQAIIRRSIIGDDNVTEAGGVDNSTPGDPSAHGDLDVTDVDLGEAKFMTPASLAGIYGDFMFDADTGAWTYTLDDDGIFTPSLIENEMVTDTLTVWSFDESVFFTIEVSVTGSNDVPIILFQIPPGSNVHLTEDEVGNNNIQLLFETGNIFVFDDDGSVSPSVNQDLMQLQTTQGLYGEFTVEHHFAPFPSQELLSRWRYEADNEQEVIQNLNTGDTLMETFTVTSLDGSATETVDIFIHGVDEIGLLSV